MAIARALRASALFLGAGSLVACGVIFDVTDDPPAAPDSTDAGAVDAPSTEDGSAALDSAASDAGADGADACAAPAACSPELLTKLGGGVLRLVAGGASLYAAHMTSTGAGNAHVASFSSSAPGASVDLEPLSTTPEGFRADSNIAVDGTGVVYWGTPNGLHRHELDGGVTELSALGAPVAGVRIAADGRLNYTVSGLTSFPSPNNGHLASCALPGCTDVQAAGAATYAIDVVAIGATRWWLGTDAAGNNLALRSGAFVSGVQLTPSRMVTDGSRIYWSTVDNLRMLTTAGNVLVDLLAAPTDGTTRVNGVALDGAGTLFVTQQSSVARCTMAAGKCTIAPLATTPGIATDVAVDATHVYWGTNDGSVYRLRKP